MFLEFDAHKTKEAIFAYQCDKLECDLQCKLYDQERCVDLNHQEGNDTMQNEKFQEMLSGGASWSTAWLKFDQYMYPYDENFMAISEYAIQNDLRELED